MRRLVTDTLIIAERNLMRLPRSPELLLAFTVFHVVIRAGLSLAALGAGIAADLVGGVSWPLVGHLEPERLVLFCAGALVFASAGFVRESAPEQPARREAWRVRLHRH